MHELSRKIENKALMKYREDDAEVTILLDDLDKIITTYLASRSDWLIKNGGFSHPYDKELIMKALELEPSGEMCGRSVEPVDGGISGPYCLNSKPCPIHDKPEYKHHELKEGIDVEISDSALELHQRLKADKPQKDDHIIEAFKTPPKPQKPSKEFPEDYEEYMKDNPQKKDVYDSEPCPDCGMSKQARNPSGHCDHLYYPENKGKPQKKKPSDLVLEKIKNRLDACGMNYPTHQTLQDFQIRSILEVLDEISEQGD